MFLKQSKYKNGRIYLSIVQGYRDENKKTKQKTIMKLGYLDELQKVYDNPIEYFKEEAKKLTIENLENSNFSISFTNFDLIDENKNYQSNLGYSFFQKIYHDLKIDNFLNNLQKDTEEKSINSMIKLLVYSKLIYHKLPHQVFQNKPSFFEDINLSQQELFNSFKRTKNYKKELQKHTLDKSSSLLNRDTTITYYHCTNYYLDFNENIEQEFKESPIIQLGLLLDNNGIPLAYDLLPINKSRKNVNSSILDDARKEFNLEKIVIVVNKGLSFNNSFIDSNENNGYIYGKNIRSATKEFREYVLDQKGFVNDYKEEVKIKSRIITLENDDGIVKQKQVITYNEKYAKRQKNKREREIIKAERIISYPDLYNKTSSRDVAQYIKNLKFEEDGKIFTGIELALDTNKIKKDEVYDGYYAIITSEIEKSDVEIRNTYRGMLKIDDSFKLTRMESSEQLDGISQRDLLETHFLVSFLELLLLRLLEKKIDYKYSDTKILRTLRRLNSIYLKENLFLFDYRDEIIEKLEEVFNVDFSKRVLSKSQIKKMIK